MKKHIKMLIARHKLPKSLFAVYFAASAFLFIFSIYALFNKVMIQYESFGQTPTTITIDPNTTYQTMTGWEATKYSGEDLPNFNQYKDQLFDKVVNEYGMNRVRLEIRSGVENTTDYWTDWKNQGFPQDPDPNYLFWRAHRYSTVNDNANPDSINVSGFQFSELDNNIDNIILPLKQKIEANGEKLWINMNYVAYTAQIGSGLQYIHNNPQEYAEFVLATYLHLQNKYGWVPDSWEVILEPDLVDQWNNAPKGELIGQAIQATAAKLILNGFTPRFVAPSTTDAANAPLYFDGMDSILTTQEISNYVKEISYHRYQGGTDANIQAIAAKAAPYGINTSMLEWWQSGNHYKTLLKDITLGNNTAWQEQVICALYNCSNYTGGSLNLTNKAKLIRQYVKKVRSGAIRIDATSSNPSADPVAFKNADGKNAGSYTVVIDESNATGSSYSIAGLPAGTYSGFYTTQSNCTNYTSVAAYNVPIPADQTIASGQNLDVSIPACGVLTVYSPVSGPTPTLGPTSTPTITPTPIPGVLNLSSSSVSVSENVASISLNIQRADGSSGTVSVNFATSNGSALLGLDYTQTQGTVTFINADITPKTIIIPIINDALEEQSETFTVTLSAPTGGASLGIPATAIVTIQDDDSPPTQVFPIGYYAFDEGTGSVAGDSSGSGINGTIYNGAAPGAVWVNGKFGKAIQFDGINDYVNLGNNFNFGLNQPFSISLWVNAVSGTTTANRMLIDKRDGSATGAGFQLRYTTTKGFPFMRIDEGTANIDTTFSTAGQLFSDSWHHIVFGRSLSEHFVYLDGVKQTPTTADSTLADLTNTNNFYIGAIGGASPSEVFSGLIDEIRIYDVALNDQQVTQLYNATNCAIGDSNCSGKVNTLDLSYLLSKFGIYDSYADFNIDGIVDSADLSILLGNFGI